MTHQFKKKDLWNLHKMANQALFLWMLINLLDSWRQT